MLAHVDRLKRKMAEENLDGLVAATTENVHYLTDIKSVSLRIYIRFGQCYAVITRDAQKVIFVSSTGRNRSGAR